MGNELQQVSYNNLTRLLNRTGFKMYFVSVIALSSSERVSCPIKITHEYNGIAQNGY